MDGGYHPYIKQKHSKKQFCSVPVKSLVADERKDNIAKKLGIPLIRIDCYESDISYIKENIYMTMGALL